MKFKLECEIDLDLGVYEDYLKDCQDNNEEPDLLSDFIKQDLEDLVLVDSVSSLTLTELH